MTPEAKIIDIGDSLLESVDLVVHHYAAKNRKQVGKVFGMKVFADENLPDDEIRFVQNGKVIARIKLW